MLIAPDKFKGTLTSREAAEALSLGIESACPAAAVDAIAVADGGEGTVDALVSAGFTRRSIGVRGSCGPVVADVAIRGGMAVLEIADVCGLQLFPPENRRPMEASSYGVGELMLKLSYLGITSIVLALGGSATTDGGVGMLSGLGAVFLDGAGAELPPGGGALVRLESIDWSGLSKHFRELEIVIASDVDSPLLGPDGAAHMFGAQKGATAAETELLENGLRNLVSVLERSPPPYAFAGGAVAACEPGAGAAGGLGFGALVLGGRIVSGADFVLDAVNMPASIQGMDLVITGEGRLDRQSLRGKLPVSIASMAAQEDVPTVGVVGHNTIPERDWGLAGFATVWALSEIRDGTATSTSKSIETLKFIGQRIGSALTAEFHGEWTHQQHNLAAVLHATKCNTTFK